MKIGDNKKKIIPVKSETSKHNNHTFPPNSTIGLHVVMNVVIFECVHVCCMKLAARFELK